MGSSARDNVIFIVLLPHVYQFCAAMLIAVFCFGLLLVSGSAAAAATIGACAPGAASRAFGFMPWVDEYSVVQPDLQVHSYRCLLPFRQIITYQKHNRSALRLPSVCQLCHMPGPSICIATTADMAAPCQVHRAIAVALLQRSCTLAAGVSARLVQCCASGSSCIIAIS